MPKTIIIIADDDTITHSCGAVVSVSNDHVTICPVCQEIV